MFDNTRVKYAGYAGAALFVILMISQLPSEFIQRFVPWMLSSAVLVGGSISWWKIKAKLDLRYQPARLGPDAALHEKFVNEFSNHLIASAYVVITLFLVLLAGRTALYFFGKTTLGTAQDASVLLVEKTANMTSNAAESIGSGVKFLVDGASAFDVNIDPKAADFRNQYSLLNGSSNSEAPAYNSAPTFASTDAGSAQVQSVPAPVQAEPQSAAPVAPMSASAQGPAEAQYATVAAGDTLFKIAQRIYGNGEMWPALLKANPALGDGNTIYAGQKLVVPPATYAASVKPAEVLPATFAGSTQQATQQAALNTPAYGPAPANAVVLKQSDTGALVTHSSGWGVEVVTTK